MKLITTIAAIAALTLFSVLGNTAQAQTINFTQNDSVNWNDGIAQDGDGGSAGISGITLQMYMGANATSNTKAVGSTMIWNDSSWFASLNNFTGITAGPEIAITNNGMPSLIIKSASAAINFNLTGIRILDWGGVPVKMMAYDNGVFLGAINLNLPSNGSAVIFTTSTLSPAIFGNVDELRIVPVSATDAVMWVGINDIVLGTFPLAINFVDFTATRQQDETVTLTWVTANSHNSTHFEVQQSVDGNVFHTIGTVPYHENTASFNFVTAAIDVDAFYRIKEVDAEGKADISTIAFVPAKKTTTAISIFPNPATDKLTIQTNQEIVSYKIVNFTGKIVQSATASGKNFEVSLNALPKGNYVLIAEGAHHEAQRYFIKH